MGEVLSLAMPAAGGRTAARVRAIALKNLLVLGCIELLARIAAGLGLVSLPPAGLAGFDAMQAGRAAPEEARLYRPSRHLIRRMRPDFRMTYARQIVWPQGKRNYEVRTNALGFRSPPFTPGKPPGVFRIACLGDSSTFGVLVEEDAAYPQVLGRLLEERFPGKFEVLNLGSPGYTTRQGLELLRREVIAFAPDLVTFAYGTNDRFFRGPLSDDALIRFNQSVIGGILFALRETLDRSYAYRLLRRGMERVVPRPGLPGPGGPQEYRVSLEEMSDNVVAARELLAERGADLVVLNNDFFPSDAREGLRAGAERAGVALLDMRDLLEEELQRRSRQLAERLGLPPAAGRDGHALLRVHAPGRRAVGVRTARYVVGQADFALGDDGREPDQVAGDGVWSGYVPARDGERIGYAYFEKTDGRLENEFAEARGAGLIRAFVRTGDGVAPLDVFGAPPLRADGSHPDEEGHALIAQRLLAYLMESETVKDFLAR